MGTDHDDVIRRLHELGAEPVEPSLASRHLTFLAAAGPVAARSRRRPLMVGAMLAGLVMGGTGLAAALPGSLPEQAGSVARSALEAVNLVDGKQAATQSVPMAGRGNAEAKGAATQSKPKVDRFHDGCTVGSPATQFTGNHGQYVKAHPDNPATPDVNEREVAAHSDCGKPLSSLGKDEATEDADKKAEVEAEKAKAEKAAKQAEDAAKPADAGRPESPGKSEEEHPPATAVKEQGSDNKATDTGNSGDAGKSSEHRPEGVGNGS